MTTPLSVSPARRLLGLVAPAWWGLLLTVAAIAAPSAFAVLDRAGAAAYVARLFAVEAPVSLAAAVAIVLLARADQRSRAQSATPDAPILLALAALACTVVGYYALQPMMATARLQAGSGPSFAVLHGASLALFGVKVGLVGVLAWRSTARRAE